MSKFFISTNLITDLKFRQQVGVKADAFEETLAILNSENKVTEFDLIIDAENREQLQINAKLFVKTFSSETALKAVTTLQDVLGIDKIDSLTISIPSEGISYLGIGDHSSSNEALNETPDSENNSDPTRGEFITKFFEFWNKLSEELSGKVVTLGVCDLETDVFFQLFKDSKIKPQFCQVNLKSCCMVPPDLQTFAKENSVKLSTHADPPTVLSSEFMEKVKSDNLRPEWIVRYQKFIRSRGVLEDKRYIMPF